MDSSKHQLGTEGCSSTESGWTMYLSSPMKQQEEDQCSYDVIENYHYPLPINSKDDQDSDDSMASDASSAPYHHHKQESYQDDHAAKAPSKSKSFNPFSSSATKPNKKEKKNDRTSNDKNTRLTANKRNTK